MVDDADSAVGEAGKRMAPLHADECAGALTRSGLDDTAAQWASVRARLQQDVGEVDYRNWMRQMSFGGIDGDEATVLLPTRFLSDWVRRNYGERIERLWQQANPAIRRVEIRAGKPATEPFDHGAHTLSVQSFGESDQSERGGHTERTPDGHAKTKLGRGEASRADRAVQDRLAERMNSERLHNERYPGGLAESLAAAPSAPHGREQARPAAPAPRVSEELAAPLDPRFSFETFVVGKPNEFAYACARRVAEFPGSKEFNPLFLYGGVGLGKTHLMHAVGADLTRRALRPATVAYMSAEKFMYRFIAAIRSQQTLEFKDQLRSVDVLMIDDLQFLIGKDNTQEEFFHTFNALIEAGKQIVVSADKSPSDLSGIEDRLRTRLGHGIVADLHATTYELRISILQAKAARLNTDVPMRVLEFLAHKITSNVRELEGAFNRLIAHAELFDRTISLETAQEVLHDVLKSHDKRVTIDEIQRRVAEHYNMRIGDMVSARRARSVARPRQVAMFLAKQLTSRSLPEIGKKFGNRDHTTVMHACARISSLITTDSSFAEDVELLKKMLEN